jgi:hypothetical protein
MFVMMIYEAFGMEWKPESIERGLDRMNGNAQRAMRDEICSNLYFLSYILLSSPSTRTLDASGG